MNQTPELVMLGLGYIGLPTATVVANKGVRVHGVDINKKVVEIINQGKIHIVEPDLESAVKSAVDKGNLRAYTEPKHADIFFVAVPTPFKQNFEPDISYVQSATEMAIPYLQPGNLYILESTSPVGTTELMAQLIFTKRPELRDKIFIAYCPERVLPGKILHELVNNDRVIGGIDKESTKKAKEFYSIFVKGILHETNARTAEMCKLIENSYRDVNIAFANEVSMICEKAQINPWELIGLANKHPRVNILRPGAGVGGHCIAVDPWFIVSGFREQAKLIKSAREVNDYKMEWVVHKIEDTITSFENQHKRQPKIACLGLAYKPDIDDLRESPSLHITQILLHKKFCVLPVEPNVKNYENWKMYTLKEALAEADIIAILVAHKEFKGLAKELTHKIVLNFCGLDC